MPKKALTLAQKAKNAIMRHPEEFQRGQISALLCKLCNSDVNCEKEFNIEAHRKTNKHVTRMAGLSKQPKLASAKENDGKSFMRKVTEAFLAADIPLKKLQNRKIQKLFSDMHHPLPAESTCRDQVGRIKDDLIEKIKSKIWEKKIFVVYDETSTANRYYANILVGQIEEPSVTYLAQCNVHDKPLNANTVSIEIDEFLKNFEVNRNNFLLLISDAARYMTSAGSILKSLYPNLNRVTCVSHLMHNCAMKVRASFPDVDRVIATVKAATVKNRTRKSLFNEIGAPPVPVVTRWGSWIEAALYYAKNLPAVSDIFKNIDGGGVLVNEVKKALESPGLISNLKRISMQYGCLATTAIEMECSHYTIEQALTKLTTLDFGADDINIKDYIVKRLDKNDLLKIQSMSNPNISPLDYGLLLKCQPSSASVERSFSILAAILTKCRNFSDQNVGSYLMAKYNSFML